MKSEDFKEATTGEHLSRGTLSREWDLGHDEAGVGGTKPKLVVVLLKNADVPKKEQAKITKSVNTTK